ncbi:MAG: SH3 domain-containing protein [Pseudomonadota bacterium]
MGKFIAFTFLMLGITFYEMSGGAEFEPELRAPIAVAQTELAPAETPVRQPEVTRAADTASLIQIAAPAPAAPLVPAPAPAITAPASFSGPLPAGEVIITPAPAVVEQAPAAAQTVSAAPLIDIRAVAGSRVNMRSGPSTDFRVLDTLPRGTEAEVLEVNSDGWARIRLTTTGQEGWMAERLLTDNG